MTETKRLLDNGNVEITVVKEIPRYKVEKFGDSSISEMLLDDIQNNGNIKIWTPVDDYKYLNNWTIDEDTLSGKLQDDKETLQRLVDSEHGAGKYKVYVFGAYIHSMTSFSITDSGDNRCQWDSSNLGFIAVPTDTNSPWNISNTSKLANYLSCMHNGDVFDMNVVDNYTDEIVDSYTCLGCEYDMYKQYISEIEEKYHVSNVDNIQVLY